jgi:hypothetical protein
MRRAAVIVASFVYWTLALVVIAISQFGDVAGDTHEKFEAAMVERQRTGVVLFLVELVLFASLIITLRRLHRRATK